MQWEKLLSPHRFKAESDMPLEHDPRSGYQRDIDRILFSSPFRRMQDKTQVFPIPKSDFIHNRLTHSVEVASVGRSLGLLAGQFVINKKKELPNLNFEDHNGFIPDDFGNIVFAACLAHDIGNPPFGHSGEKAISAYFKNQGARFLEKLTAEQINDLIAFEGNAAGFRILTNNFSSEVPGGLRISHATLGAFTKYPWNSTIQILKEKDVLKDPAIKINKFGFFTSDEEAFRDVAEKLELKSKSERNYLYWARHPLSYLMEAADTICYRVIDVEDSVKLKIISPEDAEACLLELWKASPVDNPSKSKHKLINDYSDKIGYLRAKAINSLIFQAFDVWEKNYDLIMAGNFNDELIDHISAANQIEVIKKMLERTAFVHPSVIKIELAGFKVIGGLLDEFCEAVMKDGYRNKKLRNLIPIQFIGKDRMLDSDPFKRLLKITDFVSRMTDSYAIEMYKNLQGISLPELD